MSEFAPTGNEQVSRYFGFCCFAQVPAGTDHSGPSQAAAEQPPVVARGSRRSGRRAAGPTAQRRPRTLPEGEPAAGRELRTNRGPRRADTRVEGSGRNAADTRRTVRGHRNHSPKGGAVVRPARNRQNNAGQVQRIGQSHHDPHLILRFSLSSNEHARTSFDDETAKAVAHSTEAAFFYTSASKLAQKSLGDGPRLVRELFKMASRQSPAIVFIDEVDAIGSRRASGERNEEQEIQRTMLGKADNSS
jgi:hypothetical protein